MAVVSRTRTIEAPTAIAAIEPALSLVLLPWPPAAANGAEAGAAGIDPPGTAGAEAGAVSGHARLLMGGPQRLGFPAKSAAGKLWRELGTGPDKSLFWRVRFCRLASFRDGGMLPEKELFSKSSSESSWKKLRELGMEPLKLLNPKLRWVRRGQKPSSDGKAPLKLLAARYKARKLSQLPSSPGKGPVRKLLCKLRVRSWSNSPRLLLGMVPTRSESGSLRVVTLLPSLLLLHSTPNHELHTRLTLLHELCSFPVVSTPSLNRCNANASDCIVPAAAAAVCTMSKVQLHTSMIFKTALLQQQQQQQLMTLAHDELMTNTIPRSGPATPSSSSVFFYRYKQESGGHSCNHTYDKSRASQQRHRRSKQPISECAACSLRALFLILSLSLSLSLWRALSLSASVAVALSRAPSLPPQRAAGVLIPRGYVEDI